MSKQETKEPKSVGDVVEGLEELAEAEDKVTFADVLDKFGSRSFAPIMLLLAILELTPVGAIPGVPSILAICVALIAGQMLFGRDHIWMPSWIENRSVSSSKIEKGTDKAEGFADALDSVAKGRLQGLTRGTGLRVAAAVIVLLCLLVPPLEVLPWASSIPMLAIAVMSLAIMVRDGLAMLIAWIIAVAGLGTIAWYYFTSDGSGGGSLPF